jgi:hypothetical protein
MVVSRHQDVGQNHNLLIANKAFENMAKFKYLGTSVTKLRSRRNEMRLNSWNYGYDSVEISNLPSSSP